MNEVNWKFKQKFRNKRKKKQKSQIVSGATNILENEVYTDAYYSSMYEQQIWTENEKETKVSYISGSRAGEGILRSDDVADGDDGY